MAVRLWFIVAILFFILEILSPTFFLACFGLSSLVVSLCSLANISFQLQVIIFVVSSLLTLVFARPIFINYLADNSEETRTNVDALIGKEAIVSERIIPYKNEGRVEIAGDSWLALTETGKELPVGVKVKILEVEGTKLYVKQKEENK